ncbi:Uncharacterized protein Adt_03133 [Abeliophyllum distichum]|uniref:Tf2-1-like SH3-like domain-containing protein n=1 Tax=Abeliophyllum distichum TaxID=126358 RepID=A0ABD1VY15_9LAMI
MVQFHAGRISSALYLYFVEKLYETLGCGSDLLQCPKELFLPIRVLLRLLLASNCYSLILWTLIKVLSLLKLRPSIKSGNKVLKLLRIILRKNIRGTKRLLIIVRDLVMVKLPDKRYYKVIRWKDSRLMPKYTGPLPIIKQIGRVAYRIELPSWCKTYNFFHASALKSYFADKEDASKNKLKRPTFELKKIGKRVAEAIIDHRVTRFPRKIIKST